MENMQSFAWYVSLMIECVALSAPGCAYQRQQQQEQESLIYLFIFHRSAPVLSKQFL